MDKKEKEEENAGTAVGENGEDAVGEDRGVLRAKVKQKTTKRKVRDGGGDIQKNLKSDEQEIVDRCTCGKPVQDDSEGGIECDICGQWLHPKCEGLSKECYAAIETHKLFWVCRKCKAYCSKFKEVVMGGKVLNPSHSLVNTEKVDSIEKKLTEVGKAMDHLAESFLSQKAVMTEIGSMVKAQGDVKNSVKDIETTVKNVMKEENLTYAEITKKLANKLEKESVSKPSVEVKDLQNAVADCLEQEKRRRNIVVFNVPEQDKHLSIDDQAANDSKQIVQLIMEGLKLKIHPEKVARMGKQKEGKSRLMVVTLRDEGEKWELLKMAKRLRDAGSKFERIYIAPDLSPAEQLRDKNLRKEMKERREAGEDVVIYKNKVIPRSHKPNQRPLY